MAHAVTAFPVELTKDEERDRWQKKPLVSAWQHATTTFQEVAASSPDYIGVNVPPGLIVLDLDDYKEDGRDVRQIVEERFGLKLGIDSLLQTTISGGEHHVFAVDPDVKWRQGSDLFGIKGLDTRCAGRGWICTGKSYIVPLDDFEARLLGPLTDPFWPTLPRSFLDALDPSKGDPEKERAPAAGEERDRGPGVVDVAGRGTAGDVDELRSALLSITDDSYETWYRVAGALHSLPEGFSLFDEWSQRSGPEKYTPGATRKKWAQTADMTDISPRTIFWLAREGGWRPERGWAALGYSEGDFEAIGQEVAQQGLRPVDWHEDLEDDGRPDPMPWFCLEGFIQAGSVSFAGQPGVGKTTTLVPLAAACTGAMADGVAPAQPLVPMTVHYFAEDVLQVRRCIRALLGAGLVRDKAQLLERFKIYASGRKSPKEWALMGEKDWGDEPLIVLDTISANMELESENDAAEVGRALYAIRQNVNASVWFVGHIAKSQSNTTTVTMRGSGAFAGDVQQVVTMTVDEDGDRLLQITKHRFELDDYGTSTDYVIESKVVEGEGVDRLGEIHAPIMRRYNVLRSDDPLARMARKELMKGERREQEKAARHRTMRAEIVEHLDAHGPTKITDLEDAIKGKSTHIRDAAEELVEGGILVEEAGPRRARIFRLSGKRPAYDLDNSLTGGSEDDPFQTD